MPAHSSHMGHSGELVDIFDEQKEPNWSGRAQRMIDSAKKGGYDAWCLHYGRWHGYYETQNKVNEK